MLWSMSYKKRGTIPNSSSSVTLAFLFVFGSCLDLLCKKKQTSSIGTVWLSTSFAMRSANNAVYRNCSGEMNDERRKSTCCRCSWAMDPKLFETSNTCLYTERSWLMANAVYLELPTSRSSPKIVLLAQVLGIAQVWKGPLAAKVDGWDAGSSHFCTSHWGLWIHFSPWEAVVFLSECTVVAYICQKSTRICGPWWILSFQNPTSRDFPSPTQDVNEPRIRKGCFLFSKPKEVRSIFCTRFFSFHFSHLITELTSNISPTVSACFLQQFQLAFGETISPPGALSSPQGGATRWRRDRPAAAGGGGGPRGAQLPGPHGGADRLGGRPVGKPQGASRFGWNNWKVLGTSWNFGLVVGNW